MLITLQSNNDSDASNFSNFFKETVQIEPDSEISLVNISYLFALNGSSNRETDVMLVNLDDFQIKSICKDGGIQKSLASVPYGLQAPIMLGNAATVESEFAGQFFYEPKNLNYHKLGNKQVENHNQLQVRLTDATGNPLLLLSHPTIITIDIKPVVK